MTLRRSHLLAPAFIAGALFSSQPAKAQSGWTLSSGNPDVKYEVQVPRPAGAKAQWMRFWFHSTAFFDRTDRHLAIGLRGRIERDASGFPLHAVGRGITIGDTSGNPIVWDAQHLERTHGGCLNSEPLVLPWAPGQSQVESFWAGGNHLYLGTCKPTLPMIIDPIWGYAVDGTHGLHDDAWYRYTISVSDQGVVAFTIQDINLQVIGSASVDDSWNFVPDDIRQWIGVSDGNDDAPWTVDFQNIESGWATSAD